jgi:hypothetical protein
VTKTVPEGSATANDQEGLSIVFWKHPEMTESAIKDKRTGKQAEACGDK